MSILLLCSIFRLNKTENIINMIVKGKIKCKNNNEIYCDGEFISNNKEEYIVLEDCVIISIEKKNVNMNEENKLFYQYNLYSFIRYLRYYSEKDYNIDFNDFYKLSFPLFSNELLDEEKIYSLFHIMLDITKYRQISISFNSGVSYNAIVYLINIFRNIMFNYYNIYQLNYGIKMNFHIVFKILMEK